MEWCSIEKLKNEIVFRDGNGEIKYWISSVSRESPNKVHDACTKSLRVSRSNAQCCLYEFWDLNEKYNKKYIVELIYK